jgi:hypothetical protein
MMKNQVWRLRIYSVLTGLGLAVTVIGCGETSNPVRPTGLPDAASAGAAGATSSESAASAAFDVGPELAAVRQATARFHDVSAAYGAGYTTENEPCVASPAGVMGVHAPNFSLIGDQAIDPARPELLLYEPQRGGTFKLVGVEYFQVVLLRNRHTQAVAPRFDSTPWDPAEYEVVNPAPQLFGETFRLDPPPVPTVPWHWSLHAWIWAHNPSGIFADWNPSLRCG